MQRKCCPRACTGLGLHASDFMNLLLNTQPEAQIQLEALALCIVETTQTQSKGGPW